MKKIKQRTGAPNVCLTIERQDAWLRAYNLSHRVFDACEAANITYHTYSNEIHRNPEFKRLKEALDIKDLELTRVKLRDSSHGYNLEEVREEQELQPDPKFPPKYIPDPDPKHAGKFIIDPKNPGKTRFVVVRRIMTAKHVPPNSQSLIFKLCNEDSAHYKNINHIESKGIIDATVTEHNVIADLDDASVASLAKAIVKAKADTGK